MSSAEDSRKCSGDNEQSVTTKSSRRRESNIPDIRTRRGTMKKNGKSTLSKQEKVTIFTGQSVDTISLPTAVTPNYRGSEDRLERDGGSETRIAKDKRLLRTSKRTPDCHSSPMSMSGFMSGIKSSGMKGGARRVVRKVPMGPGITSTSDTPGSNIRACAITPSPREASAFTFENNSNIKVPSSSRRRRQIQNDEIGNKAESVDISTDAPILNTLSSLSLNDDRRKRLASGPKRIPRQSSSARKDNVGTPSIRLLRSTAASRSKDIQSRESHTPTVAKQSSATESDLKLARSACQTSQSDRKNESNTRTSTKISLMSDFMSEVVTTIEIPSDEHTQDGNDVLSMSPDTKIDSRVERIRSELERTKLKPGAEEDLLDGYLHCDSEQSCDLIDSFDMAASESINENSSGTAAPISLHIDNLPSEDRPFSDKTTNESFDSVTEHFRKHNKSNSELALRRNQAQSFESSDGRTNPVAKTLSNMDASDVVYEEAERTFSCGGNSSAFSEL